MNAPANVTRFLFEVPGLSAEWRTALRVVGFEAEQALSTPYRCELELACENPALDLQAMIGQSAVLTLFDARDPQYLHGEITAACHENSGTRFTFYRVAIEPRLAVLGYRRNLRIFQDRTAPEIVQQVLDEAGINGRHIRPELNGRYPVRTYCTQYRETNLVFIQRLLAEEGIFYFFEHSHECHTLVLADNKRSFKPVVGASTVRYRQRSGMVASEESIHTLSAHHRICTGKVSLRDYHFQKSQLKLEAELQTEPFARLEAYRYPGHFAEPDEGKRQAERQLQAHQAEAFTVQGQGDCLRLAVGKRFQLEEHPLGELNSEYVITATQLLGRQPQSLEENATAEGSRFEIAFHGIPASTDYRPPRQDGKPAIEGSQTAFVTGPRGEEIYTDQYGRVKVQFHWDRDGGYGEKTSCWVRVSQGWAGNQWGSMVIPRIGMEVIVGFLNGDPDQPLITGVVHNGASPPPYALPANKARSTFKSLSTPGGGGYNELRIEDKKGHEEIHLHAQKDLDLYVKHDLKEWAGNESHLTVQNHQHQKIDNDQHITVNKAWRRSIGQTLSQQIGQDYQLKISGSAMEQAGQTVSLKAGMTLVIEAGTELALQAGSGFVKLDPTGVIIQGASVRINSGGAAMSAQSAAPSAPASALQPVKNTAPGKVSGPALVNVRRLVAEKSLAAMTFQRMERQAAPQALQNTLAAVGLSANSALTVKVQRSDNTARFASATVRINGPSGLKEAKSNDQGEVVFNGLLPGNYSALALLSDNDRKQYGNPEPSQVALKNNGTAELLLVVAIRKVSIDLQLLGAQFSTHNKVFNSMNVLLSADGKTCEGVIEDGCLTFDVPATAQRFELTFTDNLGITYLNSPSSTGPRTSS